MYRALQCVLPALYRCTYTEVAEEAEEVAEEKKKKIKLTPMVSRHTTPHTQTDIQ